MLPVVAIDNASYRRTGHERKSFVNFLRIKSARVKLADFPHLADFQNRFSAPHFPSQVPFLARISHIFFMCAKEQMLWIYTRSIIAFVANLKRGWNVPKGNNPRNAMGTMDLAVSPLKRSIAVAIQAARPRPALLRILVADATEESSFLVFFAFSAAKIFSVFCNLPWLPKDHATARVAVNFNAGKSHKVNCIPITLGASIW